jgi:hypothetical protein
VNAYTMQHSLDNLITIVRNHAIARFGAGRFIFGRAEELYAYSGTFPAVMMAVPDIVMHGDPDNFQKQYKFNIGILVNTDHDDFADRPNQWRILEPETTRLIRALLTAYPHTALRNFSAQPVEAYSHNNLYGWNVRGEIIVPDAYC